MIDLSACLAAGAAGVSISCDHYHSLPGISASSLSLLIESNRHYDNRQNFRCDSDALVFGNLVHTMTLEPDETENRYVMAPKFESKAFTGMTIKEQQQEFAEDNQGKIIINANDYKIAEKMARNVRSICYEIIDSGIKERSLFSDLGDGIIIKCRLDIESSGGDDFDLKTITPVGGDFSDYAISRHIKKYNYYIGCAFRNIVRRSLGINTQDSYLIFISSSPGNMVKVRRVSPELIKRGEAICEYLLESRREYLTYGFDVEPKTIEDF